MIPLLPSEKLTFSGSSAWSGMQYMRCKKQDWTPKPADCGVRLRDGKLSLAARISENEAIDARKGQASYETVGCCANPGPTHSQMCRGRRSRQQEPKQHRSRFPRS